LELREAIQETDRLYAAWEAIGDARRDFWYVTFRRKALKRLREFTWKVTAAADNALQDVHVLALVRPQETAVVGAEPVHLEDARAVLHPFAHPDLGDKSLDSNSRPGPGFVSRLFCRHRPVS
jgi:hypothetical protein